jgi:hypothetical protein
MLLIELITDVGKQTRQGDEIFDAHEELSNLNVNDIKSRLVPPMMLLNHFLLMKNIWETRK